MKYLAPRTKLELEMKGMMELFKKSFLVKYIMMSIEGI